MSLNLFDWIMLGIGLYVLYAGIRGKGDSLYKMDRVKEGCAEKLKKLLRKSYLALGSVMTLNAIASLVKSFFYTYKEVTPATETEAAVYEWAAARDLGALAFLSVKALDVICYVCLGVCMALLVFLIIAMRKYTNKPTKPAPGAQQAAAARPAGHILPTSAFDFDENGDLADAGKEEDDA